MKRTQEKINKILSLKLPEDKYCVYGGFVLELYRIRESDDIDIIVKNDLWKKLRQEYSKNLYSDKKGERINLEDIEIWEHLNPYKNNPEEIIDKAEKIRGIKTMSLDDLIEFKKSYGRAKDLKDIDSIKQYKNKQY